MVAAISVVAALAAGVITYSAWPEDRRDASSGVVLAAPPVPAAPAVVLTAPDPAAVDGAYLDRFSPGRTAKQADDPFLARGLWERSAAMVGLAG